MAFCAGEVGGGLEFSDVEVGAAFPDGDDQLGGIRTQLDRADPVLGRQLGQEAGALLEKVIIRGR